MTFGSALLVVLYLHDFVHLQWFLGHTHLPDSRLAGQSGIFHYAARGRRPWCHYWSPGKNALWSSWLEQRVWQHITGSPKVSTKRVLWWSTFFYACIKWTCMYCMYASMVNNVCVYNKISSLKSNTDIMHGHIIMTGIYRLGTCSYLLWVRWSLIFNAIVVVVCIIIIHAVIMQCQVMVLLGSNYYIWWNTFINLNSHAYFVANLRNLPWRLPTTVEPPNKGNKGSKAFVLWWGFIPSMFMYGVYVIVIDWLTSNYGL